MSENDEDIGDDWAAAMNEQAIAEKGEEGKSSTNDYVSAEFPDLGEQSPQKPLNSDEVKLEVILDVPVTLSLEIGRTKINIRNLLQLNQGSVVELDRFAGEPMDVLVNGTLVAHGEVVVVNDKFGIRLTDIISPSERVRKLG
ncbi:flagellar motor switch protein FliN [Methylomonas sp. AM2-LC]|uniref:flagellar motor switch protein FliN n=1 Tax=Methylomonas sp. AM2-LC TaxID=3153301 RepID=UPI003263B963